MRIAVTGAGIVSAIGIGKAETLESLLQERTGIDHVRYLQTVQHDIPVGEVKLTDQEMKHRLGIDGEPTTRTSLMGMMAMEEALAEAALWSSNGKAVEHHPLRIALVSGTTVGGMDKSEQYYLDFLHNDTHNDYIHTHDCGASTEMIANHFGGESHGDDGTTTPLFDMVMTPSTACSSAANAFVVGASLLRSGMADVAVVGGAECISRFHLNGFNSLMILDHHQCRPFDADRAGLNLGEGAAYMVLEPQRQAQQRGASTLAFLDGYGNACDAFHQTASSDNGEGALLAMQKALQRASLTPADIDYVNAHGTGTPNNDVSESMAIRRLFNDELPPLSSTKGMTGHTTSASGAVEAVVCLLALQHAFVPANYGFCHTMADGITPVAHVLKGIRLHHVMCNSFGFGGNDTSLIFSNLER